MTDLSKLSVAELRALVDDGWGKETDGAWPMDVQAFDELARRLEEAQRGVPDDVIAGVLYDFMGWLTTRRTQLKLSDKDVCGPAVDVIVEFAKMRGLKLDNAKRRVEGEGR